MTIKKLATRIAATALALSIATGSFSAATAANATPTASVAQVSAAAVSGDRIGGVPAPSYTGGYAVFAENFSLGKGNTTYTSNEMIKGNAVTLSSFPTAREWRTASGQVLTTGSSVNLGGKIWKVTEADSFGLTMTSPTGIIPVSGKAPVKAPVAPAAAVKAPAKVVVKGGIGSTYRALGGAAKLGYPTINERAVAGGVYQEFKTSKGKVTNIYWKKGVGSYAVTGGIRTKLVQVGGVSKAGFPVSKEVKSGKKVTQKFQKGTITWQSGKATTFVKR